MSPEFFDCKQYAIFFAIVLLFIVFDFASGFLQAVANNNVSSTVMRRGLWHKCGVVLAMFFALALNMVSAIINLGFDIPAVQAVTVYIVIMEARSIWENIGRLTPEIKGLFDLDK